MNIVFNKIFVSLIGSLSNNLTIIFNFRNCIPGEYLFGNICKICDSNYYSIKNDSEKCSECRKEYY